jgi:sugar/nucleoside kinase (ribokinase family)
MEPYFVGTIGKDNNGKEILKEFNDIGVKTNFLEIDKKLETNSNIIITNLDNLSSTCLNYKANNISTDTEIDITPDIIVLDGTEYELSLKLLKQFPKAKSFINLKSLTKDNIELVKLVDCVVCSSKLAQELTNIKINYKSPNSLISAYNKLNSVFKSLIINLEDVGCLYESEDSIKIMPYMKVDKVDITSIDDVFLGALVYGIANNFNTEKSLKYANIARSLSTTKLGGRTSIPSLDEVEDIYETLK